MEKQVIFSSNASLTIEVRDKDGNLKYHEVVEAQETPLLENLKLQPPPPWKRP
jgi:hypothetical protein